MNEVIQVLKKHQSSFGNPPQDASSDDPRAKLCDEGVFTSPINRRVKGSEKFWSESGGDELHALRVDAVSDGGELTEFRKQLSQPNDGFRQYANAA